MRRRLRTLTILGLVAGMVCVLVAVLSPAFAGRGAARTPSRAGPDLWVRGIVVSIKIADGSDAIDAIGPNVEAGRAWAVRIQVDGKPMTLLVHSPAVDLGVGLDGVGQLIEVGLDRLRTMPEMLVPPGSHAPVPDLSRTQYGLATPVDR
jgi:hypothetical protein